MSDHIGDTHKSQFFPRRNVLRCSMIEEKKVGKFMRALSIALNDFRSRLPKDFKETGTQLDIPQKDVDRFWRYVSKGHGPNSCWLWTGNINQSNGYGRMNIGRKMVSTHRISYFLANGVWPENTDHTCSNRSCVNPKHLESVTRAENCRRARLGQTGPSGPRALRTHCKHGHAFTPDNTTLRDGKRSCRICDRERSKNAVRAWRQRKKAASGTL